jgi:transcription initiation factor TFIID subunit 7
MSTPRPSLKLSFGKKKSAQDGASQASPQDSQPASSETPHQSKPKLTLKLGGSKATADDMGEKQKKKRAPKAQAGSAKKRRADAGSADESDTAPAAETKVGFKRLKLNASKKPGVQSIRIKNRGSVQSRPLGVGYDSEASDTEADPALEEDFILRMPPGEDCEYLRQVISERRLDRSQIAIKPLTREGRRTILRIRDKQYAATLVDLPCIVEGMKSWDKRSFYKSGDIAQMLLVLGTVQNDKEAMDYPLPKEVKVLDEKTYQYAHGLTPPLKNARRRRFRNRISTRTIEQAEREVADLIAKDEESVRPPRFELVDSSSLSRAEGMVQSGAYDDEYDDMQDAEGEMEDEMHADGGEEDDDDPFGDELAAEMERELAAGADEGAETAETPAAPDQAAATPSAAKGDESSGDESDDSDRDGDGDEDGELDEEQLAQQRELQEQREVIAELEQLIREETARWERQTNAILKIKMKKRVQSLKQDWALKKASIGEGIDADE